jgi:hypothetical protein
MHGPGMRLFLLSHPLPDQPGTTPRTSSLSPTSSASTSQTVCSEKALTQTLNPIVDKPYDGVRP